jgi:hypothetical protein
LFVDPAGPDGSYGTADDDFRLLNESPAIDSGDNDALVPPVGTDLDGHLRRVNDPLVPDTGHGTAPIVDRGAYEFQLPGDFDLDGDVDLDDFAVFSSCLSGPSSLPPGGAAPPTAAHCLKAFDLDQDADVDLPDFAVFQLRCGR